MKIKKKKVFSLIYQVKFITLNSCNNFKIDNYVMSNFEYNNEKLKTIFLLQIFYKS